MLTSKPRDTARLLHQSSFGFTPGGLLGRHLPGAFFDRYDDIGTAFPEVLLKQVLDELRYG